MPNENEELQRTIDEIFRRLWPKVKDGIDRIDRTLTYSDDCVAFAREKFESSIKDNRDKIKEGASEAPDADKCALVVGVIAAILHRKYGEYDSSEISVKNFEMACAIQKAHWEATRPEGLADIFGLVCSNWIPSV